MYGEVDKIKLGKTLVSSITKLASNFVPKRKILRLKNPHGTAVRISWCICFFISVGTRTFTHGYRRGRRTHD